MYVVCELKEKYIARTEIMLCKRYKCENIRTRTSLALKTLKQTEWRALRTATTATVWVSYIYRERVSSTENIGRENAERCYTLVRGIFHIIICDRVKFWWGLGVGLGSADVVHVRVRGATDHNRSEAKIQDHENKFAFVIYFSDCKCFKMNFAINKYKWISSVYISVNLDKDH